jgi:hypothetical protein
MIVSSFIIQANVITIVNYDRQTFIVQAYVTYEWAHKASAFATDRLFQLSLTLIIKARAYPSEASFICSTLGP